MDDLQSRDYEEKVATLLTPWLLIMDTLASAKRQGSLDSAIRELIYNNILQPHP